MRRNRFACTSGYVLSMNPITGSAVCCARAATGHTAAAPLSSVTNSRRLIIRSETTITSWLTDRDLLVVLLITGQRRRDGGATRADCGCFAKSNVAGFEYQYGGGTWRRKSSSAAFIAAMVCAA